MNHFGLIHALLDPGSGVSEELRDLVTARAFEDPTGADALLEVLIDDNKIDVDARWDELKHHQSLDVRFSAWAKKYETATAADWELAIATTRRNSPLWNLISAHAPLEQLSNDSLCAYLGVKASGKLTQPEARLVVEHGLKAGMEEVWVRALATLNPRNIPDGLLTKAVVPLTEGRIRSVPAAVHPFWRLAVACCAFSKPGTLADLVAEDPTIGTAFPANVTGHVRTFGDYLGSNIVGRAGDLEAYRQVRVNMGNEPPRDELDSLLKTIASGDVARQLSVSEQFYAPDTFDIWRSIWEHLPDEMRTDGACAHFLAERDVTLQLKREVVSHLGARARDVCEKHRLLSLNGTGRFGHVPAWLADVDRDAWVTWLRESTEGYTGIEESLDEVHYSAIQAAADDLLADPFSWHESFGAAAAVADAAGFGPDDWAQLSISHVLTIANRNGRAKKWIASVFNEHADTATPLLWEALRTSFEAELRIPELLTVVRAIAV